MLWLFASICEGLPMDRPPPRRRWWVFVRTISLSSAVIAFLVYLEFTVIAKAKYPDILGLVISIAIITMPIAYLGWTIWIAVREQSLRLTDWGIVKLGLLGKERLAWTEVRDILPRSFKHREVETGAAIWFFGATKRMVVLPLIFRNEQEFLDLIEHYLPWCKEKESWSTFRTRNENRGSR